jgi:hypothetical protein
MMVLGYFLLLLNRFFVNQRFKALDWSPIVYSSQQQETWKKRGTTTTSSSTECNQALCLAAAVFFDSLR